MITACGVSTEVGDTSYPLKGESPSKDSTESRRLENGFIEKSYKIGTITAANVPNLLMAEKRFYSPDKKKLITVVAEHEPEYSVDGDEFPIVHVFFGEQLLATKRFAFYWAKPLWEEATWIDNESAVIFGESIFHAKTLKVERINFSNLAKLKNRVSVQDARSMETLSGQPNGKDAEISVLDYAISPDKKHILYACLDRSEDSKTESYGRKTFIALYHMKDKSFRILQEKVIPFTESSDPVKTHIMWKDEDTVIVNNVHDYDKNTTLPSQQIKISTGAESQFSDGTVTDITRDGKYWITECWNDETKMVTTILCANDGSKHKLYEAEKWSGSYRFLDNRYLEVKSPDDDTRIDDAFYQYTLRLYDLETMSSYKIEFMKPIFEQYGEDTQLELFDDTIEGNQVLFTFADWYMIHENEKRNSAQFEVELLPESSMALDAPSS